VLPPDVLEGRFMFGRHGEVSGLKVLVLLVRHAGEHCGHAELTRDLLRVRRAK
jgi:hypothetical protein